MIQEDQMVEVFKVLLSTQSHSYHFKLMGYSEIRHVLSKIMNEPIRPVLWMLEILF